MHRCSRRSAQAHSAPAPADRSALPLPKPRRGLCAPLGVHAGSQSPIGRSSRGCLCANPRRRVPFPDGRVGPNNIGALSPPSDNFRHSPARSGRPNNGCDISRQSAEIRAAVDRKDRPNLRPAGDLPALRVPVFVVQRSVELPKVLQDGPHGGKPHSRHDTGHCKRKPECSQKWGHYRTQQ